MLKHSPIKDIMNNLMRTNCAKKQIKGYLREKSVKKMKIHTQIASQSFVKYTTMKSKTFRCGQASNVNK